jgi:hypothetical protein
MRSTKNTVLIISQINGVVEQHQAATSTEIQTSDQNRVQHGHEYPIIGQSIKDAATKKPTYIVEHAGADTMKAIYESLWAAAVSAVK